MSSRKALTLLAVSGTMVAQVAAECPELHVLLARGTEEEIGEGRLERLAAVLVDRFPGTTVLDVPYPASQTDPVYVESVLIGSVILLQTITEYIKECPDTKLAFLGYSQGGQIGSNLFCGTSDFWTQNLYPAEPLDKSLVENHFIAMASFGDPTHLQASFSRGTATGGNGVFNRHDAAACEALGDAFVSYCDAGDIICDVTNRADWGGPTPHTLYFDKYGDEVVDWISERFTTGEGAIPQTPTEPCSRRS